MYPIFNCPIFWHCHVKVDVIFWEIMLPKVNFRTAPRPWFQNYGKLSWSSLDICGFSVRQRIFDWLTKARCYFCCITGAIVACKLRAAQHGSSNTLRMDGSCWNFVCHTATTFVMHMQSFESLATQVRPQSLATYKYTYVQVDSIPDFFSVR